MGIRGAKPFHFSTLNFLISRSRRQHPSLISLPVSRQGGWRYLHATRRAYLPGSQKPRGALENQVGNGPGHGSGRRKNTRSILRRLYVPEIIGAVFLFLALNIAQDATGLSPHILSWKRGRPLNEDFFVPYTITSKEQVSPTAFVLTIYPKSSRGDRPHPSVDFYRSTHVDSLSALFERPGLFKFYWPLHLRNTHSHGPALAAAWAHGLWSVEIRQPQLQVSRDYTPLPPRGGTPSAVEDEVRSGVLRLLIRRVDNGEVSTYLSGLSVGDDVDLRGPHLGYDVRARLGNGSGGEADDKVVFLAGGTGIASALQVASALLDRPAVPAAPQNEPTMSVIWANRRRADCEGLIGDGVGGGAIVEQLAELQARHSGKFTVRCTVDEERTFIKDADIASAVGPAVRGRVAPVVSSADCRLHAQEWVAARPGRELPGEEKCQCEAPDGHRGAGGKNLFFVSGPDGFIETYAGAKRWAGGQELQGGVGGLLGRLMRRDPEFWRNWLVLKL